MPTQVFTTGSIFPYEYRKAVSTRPSGLIEYAATFLVEKGAGASTLSAGQIISNNVKIAYPPRTTSTNDSIFDEVEVVAYGLGTASNNLHLGYETNHISQTKLEGEDSYTVNETWGCDVAILTTAVSGSYQLPALPTVTLNKTLVRRWAIGAPPNTTILPLQIIWNTGIKNVTRTIYGDYSEVILSFGYFPEAQ